MLNFSTVIFVHVSKIFLSVTSFQLPVGYVRTF